MNSSKRIDIASKLEANRAVAVIRLSDSTKVIKVCEAIFLGGVKSIEITMTVPNAINVIKEVAENLSDHMLIGVGTVLDPETADKAISAGANYVVSPVFKKEIIEVAHKNDVPALPGCFTPTEIQAAFEAGADIIKIFPADILGMSFFKGILAPMPHLKLMPTGGVTLTNAGDWIRAGACAVGIGTALLDKNAIEQDNYKLLTNNARIIMDNIQAVNKT